MPSEAPDRKSFEEFVRAAREASLTLIGYVAHDPSNANRILFGKSPVLCPFIPIPKDFIQAIVFGASRSCIGFGKQTKMWKGEVVLTSGKSETESALLSIIVELAGELDRKDHSCSCDVSKGTVVSGCHCCRHKCGKCFGNSVTCDADFVCANQEVGTAEGIGDTLAEANANARSAASDYCSRIGSTLSTIDTCQ
jgi:hypothetical protein